MAIVTAGYDGTVDEVQFAEVLYRYSVVGPDDFKATTQAGDRIVAIADGVALGPGTRDVATAIPNIQFAAATGTRWDLVVLRRDWQPPGGSSSIVIIQGGASQAYPAVGTAATDWNRRPGIIDDQPLYLQQVNGTSLGARIDLRCWAAHGGVVAVDAMAKTYLERVGAEVLIAGTRWTYELGANNVPYWNSIYTTQYQTTSVTVASGWTALTGAHRPRLVLNGNMVHLVGGVRGGTADLYSTILTVPASLRPTDTGTMFVGSGVSSSGTAYELVLTNGALSMAQGYATKVDSASFPVFPVTCSWPIY